MAWDGLGNMYFCDNHKIRKIDTSGIISTFAGTGFAGITGEGVAATATNMYPGNITIDGFGNIYFSDTTYSIRKITAATGIITRVGGTGDNINSPYSGDGIAATTCHIGPLGIYADSIGNIYAADHSNSRIIKIDASTGIINSIAGTGVPGYAGDGGDATACKLNYPQDVAVDICGNVYIADPYNKVIRKITFNPCDPSLQLPDVKFKIFTYPNPAKEEINIEGTQPHTTYQLCNAVGSVVQHGGLKHCSNTISINHLPPGLYLLVLTDGEGARTVHKIVKE